MAIGTSWRGRILATGGVLLSAVAIAVPIISGGGPPPSSDKANIWVNTATGATPQRSPSPATYDSTGAYGSMQAALSVCLPGDTIRMRGGNYGGQSINATTACTLIGETTPTPVTISSLSTGGSSYTLENVIVDTGSAHGSGWAAGGTNVTARNLKLHGSYVAMTGSGGNGVTWDGGELGQVGLEGLPRVCGSDLEPAQLQDLTDLTIQGVTFYPQNADTTPSACSSNGFHLEMIRLDHGVNGFTLRNSVFVDGQNDNSNTIFLSETTNNHPNGEPRNLTFANNYFGSDNGAAFGVNITVNTCLNWTIAYNTFVNRIGAIGDSANTDGCTTATNTVTVGNLGSMNTAAPCTGTHLKNMWQASGTYNCGTDVTRIGTNFSVDQLGITSGTGRLTGTSAARGAGETTYCASALGNVDFEGDVRPQGTVNCDAGFDEVN